MASHRRLLGVLAVAGIAGFVGLAGFAIVALTAAPQEKRVVAVAAAEKYGEDFWTYTMREGNETAGIVVVGYAPDKVAAALLVACLQFTGHEARTIGNGGFLWPRPTAAEAPRFEADLLHCRIAHPFDG